MLTEICRQYGTVELLERYGSYMRIRVATRGGQLGYLFGLVESLKHKYTVSDYSVTHTTLEQIFQSFANLKFDESIQKYALVDGELIKTDAGAPPKQEEEEGEEEVKDDRSPRDSADLSDIEVAYHEIVVPK